MSEALAAGAAAAAHAPPRQRTSAARPGDEAEGAKRLRGFRRQQGAAGHPRLSARG